MSGFEKQENTSKPYESQAQSDGVKLVTKPAGLSYTNSAANYKIQEKNKRRSESFQIN